MSSFALRAEGSARQDDRSLVLLRQRYDSAISELDEDAVRLLKDWPERKKACGRSSTPMKCGAAKSPEGISGNH